jgi:putative spermidine/putrescine transport system ATP-binding protein
VGIGKSYGRVEALSGIDISMAPGSFVTLLGPSGSGKTTLLMIAAGFTEPTAGRVLAGGRDITALPPERRNFGVVFQNYALFPHMTIAGNVEFPLRARGMSRRESARQAGEALELVQLEDLANRRPAQLSGGQQQRVALARALVYRPEVLLLDEPLTALDRGLRDRMRGELKAIHRRTGTTFVMVTHDQDEALALSDVLVVMNQGRIEQTGAPEEVYARPATRFVAGFLSGASLLPVEVEATAPGSATVRLPDGRSVTAPASADCRRGAGAVLLLRPDQLRVAVDPAGGVDTVLSCVVRERAFAGESWRVHLDYCGTTLEIKAQDVARVCEGAACAVGFDPRQGWVVA